MKRTPGRRRAVGLALAVILAVALLASLSSTNDPARRTLDCSVESAAAVSARGMTDAGSDDAVDVLVADEQDKTVEVADVLSRQRFEWSGRGRLRSFVREVPVRIVVRESSDIVVNVGDIVSDDEFIWKSRPGAAASPAWQRRARFELRIPIEVRVEQSENVTVNVGDVFGDNVAVWTEGDVEVSNDGGGDSNLANRSQLPAAPLEAVESPLFSVQVPVTIRVSDSENVQVEFEDIVGDNVVTRAAGDADLSNLVPRLRGRAAAQSPAATSLTAGAFQLAIPVSIAVEDSSSVTVDIEDIAGDDVLATTGADAQVSNLRGSGGRASAVTAPRSGGHADISVPVAIQVRRSTDVLIDIEDIVADEVVSSSQGNADLSNLAAPRSGRAGTSRVSVAGFVVQAPLQIEVVDGQGVEVDIEDVASDDVFAGTGAAARISNLTDTAAQAPVSATGVLTDVPVRLCALRSSGVRVNIEDIASDVVVATARGAAQISNLTAATGGAGGGPVGLTVRAPLRAEVRDSRDVSVDIEDIVGDDAFLAPDGAVTYSELRGATADVAAAGALRVTATMAVRVENSRRVDVDIEDVFGDNDAELSTGGERAVKARVETSLTVAVRGGEEVGIDVASVASGNDFVLCRSGAEQSTLDEPGVIETPCGSLVFRASVQQSLDDAADAEVTIGRTFDGNTLVSPSAAPSSLRAARGPAASVTPAPRYLGVSAPGPERFEIKLRPGARLAGDAAALAAVQRAVRHWERRIHDPITVTVDVDLADGLPAGVLAQTWTPHVEVGYRAARAGLIADARDELSTPGRFADAVTLGLPRTLRATLPRGVRLTGKVALTPANAKALGFEDPNGDQADAVITLSASRALDPESAAVHELGHALGFLSVVDDLNIGAPQASPTTLDLYRFDDGGAADPTTTAEFRSFARSYVPGRAANLDLVDEAHSVATGERTGLYPGTDGDQARHWKRVATGRSGAAAMEPAMDGHAHRFVVTCADLRMMDVIGYDADSCR